MELAVIQCLWAWYEKRRQAGVDKRGRLITCARCRGVKGNEGVLPSLRDSIRCADIVPGTYVPGWVLDLGETRGA